MLLLFAWPFRPALLVALTLFVGLSASLTHAQLRIVSYNTLQGPNSGFATIVEAIGEETFSGFAKPIDVLLLQEQNNVTSPSGSTRQIVDILNGIYGAGTYDSGITSGGPSFSNLRQGIVYNTQTVELVNELAFGSTGDSAQARQTLRYQLRPVGYDTAADFYAYNNHYKASAGSTNEARRELEATAVRNDADTLGDGVHAIYAGDYNMQSSSEAAFQELISAGPGQAHDPINRLGHWNNDSSFADVHTQSTCEFSTNCPGFATGGVDDRFDFQLVTAELLDGEGLSYISDSYHAFGNNGSTFNDAINVGNTITFSGITSFTKTEILNALESSSDHLPVVADYQLPAMLEAVAGTVPPVLALGQPFNLDLLIRNAANVVSAMGADELDYSFTTTGDLLGSGSGVELALDPGATHFVTLDTNTIGAKSGSIIVSTSSQGAANSEITIPINYQVGGGAGSTEQAIIARSVLPNVVDNLNVTSFQFGGDFTTIENLPGSDAQTLAFSFDVDMFGFEDRSDSPPPVILDDSLAGLDTLGIIDSSDTDNFFGVVDIENGDNSGPLSAEWTFDISEAIGGLTLSIDMAAMGDFEANNNSYLFETSIDGSPFASAFSISIDEDGSQTYIMEDGSQQTLDDPVVVDGTMLDNNFQTFTVPILGAGSELTLRFTSIAEGSFETFAFRNILVEGLIFVEGLAGDYNGDGTVNLADYVIWRDVLGATINNGSGADGDGNGVIDAGDYNVWKMNFGESLPQSVATNAQVPEPSALAALLVISICFIACCRQPRMAA